MDKKFKRVFTSLKSRGEAAIGNERSAAAASSDATAPIDDTPEANIVRAIRNFCDAGNPGSADAGEEVLYLPTIVDMAESSPGAAAAAATSLRKNLALANNAKPYIQHKSIMLMRILADNPGPTFTRNLAEPKFAGAVKDLLRQGRDPNVLQILSETLAYFTTDAAKAADPNLQILRDVWSKFLAKSGGSATTQPWLQTDINQQPAPRPTLPPPHELVGRISEATTSAKLLDQLLSTTPPAEIPTHELIREFADRCKLAQRSVQSYIASDRPPPDVDTLTTLIETNDVLLMALARHRKAVKDALQRGEVHGGDANARLVDVGDPAAPDVMPENEPAGGAVMAGAVGGTGATGGVGLGLRETGGFGGFGRGAQTETQTQAQTQVDDGGNRRSVAHAPRRAPPEPPADGADVSPVSPQMPVSYRF
ncbi:hypothetical protein EDC01DRAFT_663752 [Geopyxis carbonaria]|nr:hypothetical protein EDC01DRAFT_663752 [Geopyxis carbonaria]